MSLLLEALKKSERTKRALHAELQPLSPSAASSSESSSEAPSGTSSATETSTSPSPELTLAEPVQARGRSKEPVSITPPPKQNPGDYFGDPDRKAAEKLFDARFRRGRRNVRTLAFAFFIGLSALGLGIWMFYVWQQISRPGIATLQPAGPPLSAAPGSPAMNADTVEPSEPMTAGSALEAPPMGIQVPVQQPGPSVNSKPHAENTVRNVLEDKKPSTQTELPKATSLEPPAADTSGIQIRRGRREEILNPEVTSAYSALLRGDLENAWRDYDKVLESDPLNRDALLGLAAIASKTGRMAEAETYYRRVLALDPRDAMAHAGLVSLRPQTNPIQTESQLKSLIARQPDAAPLHCALGNQYAAQSRWPEAQEAYFRAWTIEPNNADFAFNLAVSLDHLNQGRLAAEYYRKAIDLAGRWPANFDREQAVRRASELGYQS